MVWEVPSRMIDFPEIAQELVIGVVTEALLSVPVMVDVLKKKLKRNLTTEEWNYYIGKNVPYESFINGKEVKR